MQPAAGDKESQLKLIDTILNTDLFQQKGVDDDSIRKLILKYSKNPPAEMAA